MKTTIYIKIKDSVLNDVVIFYLILTNAVIIFIQEFNIHYAFLNFIEGLLTLLFFIEMIIKIKAYSFKNYISDKWNRLDFFLILISIPALFSLFMSDGLIGTNIFLTLRVLRVFKFFRLIRFLPNIGQLINGVKRAIRASYVVLIGFFALVFIFSILNCSFFKNVAPEYFSNPLSSFYSMFRLFSVEGWYEIPDLIASRTNSIIGILSVIYFMVLLLSGGILGLSLVNSIFVDAMVADNNDEVLDEIKGRQKHKKESPAQPVAVSKDDAIAEEVPPLWTF